MNNRVERFIIDIFTTETSSERHTQSKHNSERYRGLLRDIDEKYSHYTIEDAARFMALSVSYFSKFFKSTANMTFTDYLNSVRVEKAIEMLRRGGDTKTDIAINCGFGTIRNFNRVFKQITGFCPRDLPESYNAIDIYPTYKTNEPFDPTSDDAELLTIKKPTA